MQYGRPVRLGLFVCVSAPGTMTSGEQGAFGEVGSTDIAGARRQVDVCPDARVNPFETASIYFRSGAPAIEGKR